MRGAATAGGGNGDAGDPARGAAVLASPMGHRAGMGAAGGGGSGLAAIGVSGEASPLRDPAPNRQALREARRALREESDRSTPAAETAADSASAMVKEAPRKRRRGRGIGRWLARLLLIGVPVAAASAYWLDIASDRYVSEASFYLVSSDRARTTALDITSLLAGNNSSDRESQRLIEFVTSKAMLELLEGQLSLRQHYAHQDIDLLSRLPADASFEEFHEYYLERIDVYYDATSATIEIKAQAFDPQTAQQIVQTIVTFCERWANSVGSALAEQELGFLEKQVASAEQALRNKTLDYQRLREDKNITRPEDVIKPQLEMLAQLRADLSRAEIDLAVEAAVLRPDSPQLQQMQTRVEGLRSAIEQMQSTLVANDTLDSATILEFQELELDLDFLRKAYESTLSASEVARIEAVRQLRQFIIINKATLPDEAILPDREYKLMTSIVVVVLVFLAGQLLVTIIRDHRD